MLPYTQYAMPEVPINYNYHHKKRIHSNRQALNSKFYNFNFNPLSPSFSSVCIDKLTLLVSPAFTRSLNFLPTFSTLSMFMFLIHNSTLSLFFLAHASAPVINLLCPNPASPISISRTSNHVSSIWYLSSFW